MTRALAAAYAVYLVAVGYLVWNPDSSTPGSAVLELADLLARLGLPASGSTLESGVELGLNVVMFVPLSLLGAFLFRCWQVAGWVVVGAAASTLIEVVQWLALPTRSGTVRDVVANTLGALVGIAAALVVARISRRRPGRPA